MLSKIRRFTTPARQRLGQRPAWVRHVRLAGLSAMIQQTQNFSNVTWLGWPIWQNPLDAWLLQQAIVEDGVDFVIECGTNRGGSAFYMASIFDLLGRGHVVTVDVKRLHDIEHQRIDFLIGSSTDPDVLEAIRSRIREHDPARILVMLDSDHSARHVAAELRAYADFVPLGGYMYVQDGCIDELPVFARHRPGPLAAINGFVQADGRFVIDEERSDTFLLSHSPGGWLRRCS